MNFISLLPRILQTVGSVLGMNVVKDAGAALASFQMTPEQQVALQAAMLQHEEAMQRLSIEEMKTAMSESMAMIASPDKFVSRARPLGLYIFYLVSAGLAASMIFGSKIDPTAILTILGPLAGVGGTYTWMRTKEKLGNGTHQPA